jgi:hypothetical protein
VNEPACGAAADGVQTTGPQVQPCHPGDGALSICGRCGSPHRQPLRRWPRASGGSEHDARAAPACAASSWRYDGASLGASFRKERNVW